MTRKYNALFYQDGSEGPVDEFFRKHMDAYDRAKENVMLHVLGNPGFLII